MLLDSEYDHLYKVSILEPEKFWDEYAKGVIWSKPYTAALEEKESHFPKWFVGGEINMSYNCLDRQVLEGHGDDVAVIYDSPARKIIQKITYKELLESVELLAGVLVDRCGMKKGDKAFFSLPNIPQSLIGMLACARIGVIYTFVFGGFASKEISTRIVHFKPKIIITTNIHIDTEKCIQYKDKIDLAIKESGLNPDFVITYNIPQAGKAKMNNANDLDWDAEILKSKPHKWVPVESSHPLHVMYTSGTTGDPKPLVFPTGGTTVQLKNTLEKSYAMKPFETILATSTFSWILGQSLMSYAALMSRNPTVIYEGKFSERNEMLEFLRIMKQHQVSFLIGIPTVFKCVLKHCNEKDLAIGFSDLKGIGLGGEPHDSVLDSWISKTFQCPVFDVWGQTELGCVGIGPCLGYKRSDIHSAENATSILAPGILGKIIDEDTSKELPKGKIGRLILKLPLSPARATTFLYNDKRFVEIYFNKYPGYYDTMDCAVYNEDNSWKIVSREDNIIHVAATRINGGSVEEACLQDRNLEQVAVVPFTDEIKGFVPFAFLVRKLNDKRSEKEVINTAIQNVLDIVGDVASFKNAVIVKNLPKNINGKIMRKSLEMMVNRENFKVSGMVENIEVYHEIHDVLCCNGYNPSLPTDI